MTREIVCLCLSVAMIFPAFFVVVRLLCMFDIIATGDKFDTIERLVYLFLGLAAYILGGSVIVEWIFF